MSGSIRSDPPRRAARSIGAAAGLVSVLLAIAPLELHAQTFCVQGSCGFNLVGTSNSGNPDPHGQFRIRIGVGPTCTPLSSTLVALDFSQCVPDIRLCDFQPTASSVSCPMVFTQTDADGYISLDLVGGANNTTGAVPGYSGKPCDNGCVVIRIGGVPAGHLSVGAFDENGSGGVNPVDISLWLTDSFSGSYYGRSDFDFSGRVSPPDLSLLLSVSLAHESPMSCTLYCL